MVLTRKKQIYAFVGGFTLIELIVAMAVMAELMIITTMIFSNVMRLQKRAEVKYSLQQDSRFVLEKLSQELRTGTVDYAKQNQFRGASTLYLLTSNNDTEVFSWANNKLYFARGSNPLINMTPQKLQITNVAFYIAPEQDPLTMAAPLQPRVTVIMTVTQGSKETLQEEQVSLNIQTTVSSRVYKQ